MKSLLRLAFPLFILPFAVACINLPRLSPGTSTDTQRVERTLKVNKDNVHANFIAGRAALERNDPDDAAAFFRHATSLNPKFEEAWYGLGVAHLDNGNAKKALAAFEEMERRFPQSALAHEGAASAHYALGDLDAAESAARAALALDPQSAQGHRILGEVEYARGNYAEAVAAWNAAISADRSLESQLRPIIEDLTAYVERYR